MATIRVRTGTRGVTYQAVVRQAGHKPLRRSFKSKTLAKRWAADMESAQRKGETVTNEAHKHTLAEAIERFLRQRPDLGRDAVNALGWWSREHGHKRLSTITDVWIMEVRDSLVGGLVRNPQDGKQYRKGAGLANRRVTYLSAVLGKGNRRKPGGALAWKWILRNPAQDVAKLPEPPGRTRFLTDDEREALLNACSADPTLYVLVLCALSSGARAGELLALRWQDLDLAGGKGVIHTSKSGEGRTLYFVGAALEALKAHAKVRPLGPDARVFASDPSGRFPYQYGEPFREACKKAKLKNFRFHDCRHSTASYLAQQGASLHEIGAVLGHRSPETTRRYAHLVPGQTAALVSRVLGEKLKGGRA